MIIVGPGGFETTADERCMLTTDLDGCVGIELRAGPVRSLGHIFHGDYEPDFAREWARARRLLDKMMTASDHGTVCHLAYLPCRYGERGWHNPMAEAVREYLREIGIGVAGWDNKREVRGRRSSALIGRKDLISTPASVQVRYHLPGYAPVSTLAEYRR